MTPPHFLRALSSRNYRLYFLGQSVSLLGNWMTSTAAVWLAYHLTGSTFVLGLVYFANQIPVLILAPFAGVWVDRLDGLKLVRITQVLGMVQSAALAAFALSGHMTVAALLWLSLCQGFINAVDFPARQTLVYHLAGERAHLSNAIALNSMTFNLARLIGPAIAGFIIAGLGPGFCFTIDAASYLAVLFALSAVRLAPRTAPISTAHPLADLRDGVRYCWSHPAIRRLLLLVAFIGLAGFAHVILAPAFAKDIYLGDARTLGFLMSAIGVGSLAAGFLLSARTSAEGLDRIIAAGVVLGAIGLAGIGASPWLSLALLCFAITGGGCALVMIGANTRLQHLADDEKRGRVLSLFSMSQGFFPLGSLLVGAAAEATGLRWAVAGCVAALLVAAYLFTTHARRTPAPSLSPNLGS